MIGDIMICTIYTKPVKIRVSHNCFGCGRKYPRNTIMNRDAVKDGNSVFTAYMCKSCEKYIDEYFDSYIEFGYGDLHDGVVEMEQEENKNE